MVTQRLRKAALAAALLTGAIVYPAAGQSLLHQTGVPTAPGSGVIVALPATPDLKVQGYQFVPSMDKGLRVKVHNVGVGTAGRTVLRLTIRRIGGTPAGRTLEQVLLPLAPGDSLWVAIDASSILPNSVALADTTFRLDADAGKHVAESNESNNRLWHNL